VQSVIHIIDHPLLPEDESITEAFPDVKIRSDTGNEEEHDHDHDGDDDHDHGDEVLGEGSSGFMPVLGHMIATIAVRHSILSHELFYF
jgi:ABC-type Zn2+ transport system substrate-binding protein/surface adhesin